MLLHNHRRNFAKRSVQMCKNQFIADLSTCDPSFSIAGWNHLMTQCGITLNHLCPSRYQPKLSSPSCLFFNFSFNRKPLAFPGTKILAHETPQQRRTPRHRNIICRTCPISIPLLQGIPSIYKLNSRCSDPRLVPSFHTFPIDHLLHIFETTSGQHVIPPTK